MSGLAEVLFNLGYTVSGSDLATGAVLLRLKELGITTFIGHSAKNIMGADAVVTSTAVQAENPEVVGPELQAGAKEPGVNSGEERCQDAALP